MVRALDCVPVGLAFIVEIAFLGGRAKLGDAVPVHSVILYDGEGKTTVRE